MDNHRLQADSGGVIKAVAAASAAAGAGLRPGDRIMSLGGQRLRDIIDYQFILEPGEQELILEREGERLEAVLSWQGDEDPGIIFTEPLFERVHLCRNKCPFCFVNQMPRGLRKSFYVKDDDFRLSFLYGNFVTLNNLATADFDRIAGQRLSPLHVSVHATDPAVRGRLMGCDEAMAAAGLEALRRLGEAGIETHIQIVLCPGLNDGAVLRQTIEDLAEGYPRVASVGVVPVAVGEGVSDSQRIGGGGLVQLRPVKRQDCLDAVELVAAFQNRFRRQRRGGLVYAADEFYLRAGLPLPGESDYDDFPQYENGIGIAASFLAGGEAVIRGLLELEGGEGAGRVFLLTGTLAAGVVGAVCDRLNGLGSSYAVTGQPRFQPLVALNTLFGPHVTVTGLLSGKDILAAAREAGAGAGDLLLVPPACVAAGAGERFIDDLTVAEVERGLGCGVGVADGS